MGLLNWLERKLAGDDSAKLTFDKGQEEFAGLNLKQVLDAHLAWNDRLTKYLDGTSQENLDVHQIAPDNLCILGKWIYGPGGKQFEQRQEFIDLRQTHKEFHLTAGQVLVEHSQGNKQTANQLLATKFRALSGKIQLNLVRLYASAN
ncbi:CZB domain-containing protein [Kaarinaea lacus]